MLFTTSRWAQLYRGMFHSDGEILNNGHITNVSGDLLRSQQVLDIPQKREEERLRTQEERADLQRAVEEAQWTGATVTEGRNLAFEEETTRDEAHKVWLSKSAAGRKSLDDNNLSRSMAACTREAQKSQL